VTIHSVGVDGFAKGWVAVELRADAFVRAWVAPTLATLLAGVPPVARIGVDIPLGGLDSEWRTADRAAKALLGGKHASVFSVPPRAVWDADSHASANRLCRQLTGMGVSVQAWGLMPKVREADLYREAGPHKLFEVHPELVFATLAGERLAYGKKTWNGQATRRALLARVGVVLPDDLGLAGVAPVDDVLDAGAVAWCAYQIGLDTARRVPDPPDQNDPAGHPIVIWY